MMHEQPGMEKLIPVTAEQAKGETVGQAPDARWVVVRENGRVAGRCSLWWSSTPSVPGHRLGVIGHYSARDRSAAHRLLRHACEEFRARGCTLAVGPMDGNTWRRYRLITERGSEPVFFLEPDNPADWPGHFHELGFVSMAQYRSAINTNLSRSDPRIAAAATRFRAQGILIRTLDVGHLNDELRRIYAVSLASFCNNFLYTPISEIEFIEQYRAVLPYLRSELVLIAEQGECPIGFIFALPDLLQARRGEAIDTIIIKTVAVLPGRAHAGLGSLLVGRCQEIACDLGYTRAIHALMHEANGSRNISRHYAQTMRGYTLYARRL